jgi:O-antigen/teichoic acid export membrane protein
VTGQLQGQGQFFAFGLTRFSNALGRLAIAILFISLLSGGLLAALLSLPLAALLAFLVGLLALGWHIWQPAPFLPRQFRQPGPLLFNAFLALTAYMSLLSMDLIWVNRLFAPETAAAYATAVLLRRVLALLPGAVIVVMYPRAVARVAQGQLPDKLLGQTALIVVLPTLLLTAVYARFGTIIIQWTFGAEYTAAAPLLLGMGIGMVGFGLTAVWLNFYLATRPLPFVALLVGTAVAQIFLLSHLPENLATIVVIFAFSGWVTAVGGLLLYLGWLRPSLKSASSSPPATPDPY